MTDTQITTVAPANVFITGAATALGREVTRQLIAAGHRVTGAVATSVEASALRTAGGIPAYPGLYRAGELRSAIMVSGSKIVINLAPQVPNHLPQHAAVWDEQLAEATTALMEASQTAGVEFVIHTSYAFASAKAADAAPLLRAAKAAERVALQGIVPACVLRFGFLYGSESDELVDVREKLRLGRNVPAGSDASHANWIYVGDAARAILMAVQQRPTGALLNIVDNQPTSPSEFLTYFAETQGLGAPGGRSFFERAPLSKAQLAIMNINTHADNAQAGEVLGWTPRFASYREGIEDTLLSWRAQEAIVPVS